MSIIRVFKNPLDGNCKEEYKVDPGTLIIDFLQIHYPNGFGNVIRVFAGTQEIEIDDLDYSIKPEEQITILVMPGATNPITIAAGKILLQALIATAIGFVINFIFKPSIPGGKSTDDESVVYSLSPTRNEARLGLPIASHYGTVSYPPSYASAPYVFFFEGNNTMFVDELLCLGQGYMNIEEIYIGETPLSDIEDGSVKYWTFLPHQHKSTLGVIEDKVSVDVANTETPWRFSEDVYTSPEIDGWIFNTDLSDASGAPAALTGEAKAAGNDPITGQYLLGRIEEVDSSIVVAIGDTMTITGSVSNNGSFVIGSIVIDPTNPLEMTLFQIWSGTHVFVDETLSAQYSINIATDNMTAGPFRSQKLGSEVTRIDCDIVFPQGLYRIDESSGNVKTNDVELEFTHQMIDESTGDPIGAPIIYTREWVEKHRTPVRATVSSGDIPHGAYETTVRRTTALDNDTDETDETSWVSLKGYVLQDRTKTAYGDVTMLAVRLKATNGIAQAARNRIRVVARRTNLDGFSNNPAVVIRDIWTNTDYGMGRPIEEFDQTKLDELESLWGSVGPLFDGSFDTRSTGFDSMQAVASMTGSRIIQDGGLTTIVQDGIQSVRVAMFSSANIIRGSMKIDYTFDTTGDFDGAKVEYRHTDTFDAQYAIYPPGAVNPEDYTLFGCTDGNYAMQFATYLWNVKAKRRKLVTFQTELEGLIPIVQDRIAVAHPMPSWGQSGVFIKNIDATTWMVDQPLEWSTARDNYVIVRGTDGVPSQSVFVTQGSSPNIIVFPGIVPDIFDPQGMEPSSYTFGISYDLVKDFVVTRISPKGDTVVEIQAQVYDPVIYEGGPPQMTNCQPSPDTLSTIFDNADYDNTRLDTTFGAAAMRANGFVAVKDNIIYAQDPAQDTNHPRGSLYVSTDFGQIWTKLLKPFDDVWDNSDAQYSGWWGTGEAVGNFGMTSFRFISGILYSNYFYDGERKGSIFSLVDGGSWVLENTGSAETTFAADANGTVRVATEYSYIVGKTSAGELMWGGRGELGSNTENLTQMLNVGQGVFEIGQDLSLSLFDITWAIDNFDEAVANPPNSNCYACFRLVDGWQYVNQSAPGFTNRVLAIPPDQTTPREVTSMFWWAGGGRWQGNTSGTWYNTDSLGEYAGDFVSTDCLDGPWVSGGGDLLMPMNAHNDELDANYGKYVSMSQATPSEVDYSSLLVKGPDDGDTLSFALYYVEEKAAYAFIYAFENTEDVDTGANRFYMRINESDSSPAGFGNPQTLNLPTGHRLYDNILNRGPFILEYSKTNKQFVFGTVTYIEGAGNLERLRIYRVMDGFCV